MAAVLARWKNEQEQYLASIALKPTPTTPVVNNDLGNHLDPDGFNRWFRDWCCDNGFGQRAEETEHYIDSQGRSRTRKKGYKGLTPHMLRHTQATLLIGANTDVKTVQSRLGHSSASMTLNTYSHALDARDKEAVEAFSSLLDGAANQKED